MSGDRRCRYSMSGPRCASSGLDFGLPPPRYYPAALAANVHFCAPESGPSLVYTDCCRPCAISIFEKVAIEPIGTLTAGRIRRPSVRVAGIMCLAMVFVIERILLALGLGVLPIAGTWLFIFLRPDYFAGNYETAFQAFGFAAMASIVVFLCALIYFFALKRRRS